MRDRLKYQEEQFNFMADALTERCWVCTKLCDAERGCIVAPEAYAGHDVLACSDNHFNRAYEMAMGIKPANRTFYDFARVAEQRDEGRGKDYGFRVQEIIFEPNFPPYRREELSKSLRAETFEADEKVNERTFLISVKEYDEPVWLIALRDDNDSDYRPMTDEEWKKTTQSLPQNFTFRIPIYFSEYEPEWRVINDEVKDKIADETGWFPLYYSIHERLDDGSVVEVEMWSAESFEADCRDCYGTGGLYDSRLGIDDECASCGGTGEKIVNLDAETFEAEQTQYDVMKGKFAKGHEYANYISLHDSFEEAEAVAKRERKKLEKDEAIFIVEESFDDETFEIDTTLLKSISKSPMIKSFPDASKDSFGAETVSDLELKKDSCCCGATKKTPCVCMILGSDCSAKKPMCACYRLKAIQQKDEKEAETFEAEGEEKIPNLYDKTMAKLWRKGKGRWAMENLKNYRKRCSGGCKQSKPLKEMATIETYRYFGKQPESWMRMSLDKMPMCISCMENNWVKDTETFNATTNSKKSEIVPFSPDWLWSNKHFPLVSLNHTQVISKIVDGEVLEEPKSIVVNYPITNEKWWRDIEPITMKWGELFKLCKENDYAWNEYPRPTYTFSLREGGEKYDTRPILSAFKYLPKRTVLTIYADHDFPLEVIFDYGGEKWVYRQPPAIELEEDYKPERPKWVSKLMKDSVEVEEGEVFNRHDKGYVAGLFLKSVNDARLNGILKQTNYQDSDVVGFIMPFDLKTRKLAKDYEPLVLKDNFGKSNKYLVINGTPYNYDYFNSMLMRLPPTTEVRISGKPKYPLMFEFKFLNENYLMFLAPYVGDDFDASQHGDYAKEVMSKSGAGFGFKKPPKAKKLSKEEAEKAFDERRDKIRKRMFYPKGGVGLYSPAKERFEKAIDGREAKTDFNDASKWNQLLEKALPLMTDAEMEDYVLISTKGNKEDKPLITAFFEMIVEERGEGNDPDFDPEKADRDNDGEISDWERAVGNAVAKGIREHKERKEAESRPVSYMVKSDAHKLTEASKRIHDKADKNREYPEWWKSKLSVVRNDADKLSDFLDYAVVEGVF